MSLDHNPGWDPFFTYSALTSSPTNSSLMVCLSKEQAVLWRICEEVDEKQYLVHMVGRHWTGQLTCVSLARQLATIFCGTASGNILAFPARIDKGQQINNK